MADRDPKASRSPEDEDFLRRWSRRKHRDAARVADDERTAREDDAVAEPAASGTDNETPADLPPVESLDAGSDYSRFLQERVPESLKRAALKKLFGLPQFNVRDGLDDYDEDYTAFAQLGDTITADMKHHAERLRQRAAQRDDAAAHEPDAPADQDHEEGAAQAAADPDAVTPPDREAPDDDDRA